MSTRPTSRQAGISSRLSGKMSIADRPITQQQGIMRPPSATPFRGTGLKPVPTGTAGISQRQVQDRSYFISIIRATMTDLGGEISNLRSQTEECRAEIVAAHVYEKRVRELAEELTGLQEQLSDYNLLIDGLNTGVDISHINLEINEINEECENFNKKVEQLFIKKQSFEDQATNLKEQLKEEQKITEKLVSKLSTEDQHKFGKLQIETSHLDNLAEKLQNQLDIITNEKINLEKQISDSEIHQELFRLCRRLEELKKKKETLVIEEQAHETPGQQRDSLLAAVKAHNTELAALDAQTDRIKQTIDLLQTNILQAEQILDQTGTERHTQYGELKKREAVMEEFLSHYEISMKEETNRRIDLEIEVVDALAKCSSLLIQSQQLPSVDQYSELKDQLGLKEGEVERAKFTTQGLSQQETQLQIQMKRVMELEQKVSTEMSTLKSKMLAMQSEMGRLSDLPSIKDKEDVKRREIERRREKATKDRDIAIRELRQLQEDYTKLQNELSENELWAQLNHLENKWSQINQNNFTLTEHLASRQALGNFQPIKFKTIELVAMHNKSLKNSFIRPHD